MQNQDSLMAPDHDANGAAYVLDRRAVSAILYAVEVQDREQLITLIEPLHAADVADLLEQITAYDRLLVGYGRCRDIRLQGGKFLHEFRDIGVKHAKHILGHENLAVTVWRGANTDAWHWAGGGNRAGNRFDHSFHDYAENARFGQRGCRRLPSAKHRYWRLAITHQLRGLFVRLSGDPELFD